MNQATSATSSGASFWRAMFSLWDTLLMSLVLGAILTILSGEAGLGLTFWAVFVCVALAYGKSVGKGNSQKTALAGVLGAQLALVVNNIKPQVPAVGGVSADQMVDFMRMLSYPAVGWVVTEFDQRRLGVMARAWNWLVPAVVLPAVTVWLLTGDLRQVLTELVFTTGCALILHLKKVGGKEPTPAQATSAAAQ
jgi:hypothetical protein